MKKSDREEDLRLPIKLDSSTNGEYWPMEPGERLTRVAAEARKRSDENARKLRLSRREYLASACGAATVLLGMNQLGCGGGSYRVPREATLDRDAARAAVAGDEFIFDVQTHQVSADRPWWDVKRPSLADFLKTIPQAECGEPHWASCFTDDVLIREVFLESDTQIAVVSALWGDPHPVLASEEKYGYPPLTPERKAKIFGLNAARVYGVDVPNLRKQHAADALSAARPGYANAVGPSFRTHGPRTRREMIALLESGLGH